ncbi:hypothetical protein VHUM_03153 [Vanrija humicola]|uniref:Peptidyl-prolyl cis-trans isomerase n=1 Tax=Vanrija humicola TaxID=5417 RepID=A0A7D8UZG0_VANHU|nr:hypothetical protein VHUM_03153 [Vanrija humicola]
MSSGWEVRFSNSRQLPYFYNAQTSQSTWDAPEGLSDAQIGALPGAAKYLSGPPPKSEGQVRASHILAKHSGSRRPSSWKQANVTRSLDDARSIIEGHIAHLGPLSPEQRAAEFARIASTESDCSSARKGGDLGWFGRGAMQKSFEDGTYALEVGELSPVIVSDSGVHVILRTG